MKMKKLWLPIIAGLGLSLALAWLLGRSLAVAAPTGVITVNTAVDGADGECVVDCTLREAIIEANGNGQDNTIVLGTDTYNLSLTSGTSEPEYGDLDIRSGNALTITGNGPENTTIDANGIDRVFDMYTGMNTVVISGVTIYGGVTTGSGAGIYGSEDDLSLINVVIISNTTTSGGGGIRLDGSGAVLRMDENCLIARNVAGYEGGGLSLTSGAQALLGGGRIVSNTALLGGGVSVEDSITFGGVEIVSNTASSSGGGVYVWGDGVAMLSGGGILSNTAGTGGGLYVAGALTQTGPGVIGYNVANTQGGGAYLQSGTLVLNGGQIVYNRVTGTGDNGYGGGGVYVAGSDSALIQTGGTIGENTAEMHGGGVYADWSMVILDGGQIFSNTAKRRGGGVYLGTNAAFTQTGGLISRNVALGTANDDGGGGIYSLSNKPATLTGGQVLDNRANRGGGLYLRVGSFNLLGGEIVDNGATLYGGGVYVDPGIGWSTSIEGGRIVSNTADYGGGLYAAEGDVILERGAIVGNVADLNGGGVYHDVGASAGVLTLINTTVSGNSALVDGGALFNANGTTVLTHTTVASNTAGSGGYGISKGVGSILAKNTIVAYNAPWSCDSGALSSQGHNIADDFTCNLIYGGDQHGVDPQLPPLSGDRGTLVHTIAPGDPTHDAGACQTGITIDQRGMPRFAPCDVGAYEYVHAQLFLPLALRNYP